MNILTFAIDLEGGVSHLAKALGVTQPMVSNWKARGLPRPWRIAIESKYAKQIKATSRKAAGEAV